MEFGPVIKNPVLDINKLVRQGTMLNQSVQNVEGDSTADQATVDLLARKDPVIQEISVGMSGEELKQYTVSGTPPLSLPNSLGKPLKAWSVDLLQYQEGTGDPSPSNVRAIHGTDKVTITTAGKNLIDDSIKTAQGQSLYIGANSAYVYPFHLVAGTYTLSVFGIPNCYGYIREENDATHTVVIAGSTTGTVTLAKAGNYRIWLYGDNAVSGNVSGVMLTVGSDVPTAYTPYLAPFQTVIDVPPLGKNLIDSRTALFNREINSAGGWAYALSARSIAVHVKPNTTYVLSGYPNDMSVYRVGLFNGSLPEDIDHSTYELSGVSRADNYATFGSNKVITTGIDTNYIIIQFNAARWDDAFQTTQLEVGSTPTSYEPYNNTVYTGTIGSEGGESRSVYVLLNDPDKWVAATGTVDYRYEQQFSDRKRLDTSFEGVNCTYLPVAYSATGNYARWTGATTDLFGFHISNTTLDQIKADAVAGKIAICYELATPTTFAVPSVTIPTPTGTATTWATAEDGTVESMEVTYVGKA